MVALETKGKNMLENMMDLVNKKGEKHGIINRVANSVPDNGFKRFAEKDREAMKKMRAHESEIVEAEYFNSRGPNERLTKPYCHWDGDPIDTWHCIPGETYSIPVGMMEEVNDPRKKLPQRSEVLDANGRPTLKDGPGEQIHRFLPIYKKK